MSRELARYECESGEITLTDDAIRNVISTDPNVTDKEVLLFAALCKAHKLNPFIKEAHLVKYGTKPATMVVGKDVFTKRAFRNPRFRGMQAGVMVMHDGRGHEREGSLVLDGEQIVGGWAKVYVEGCEVPFYDSVSFSEYAGRKKDGSLNSQWASKPATMIRKVALVHALREAFPEDFGGLYDESEMGVELPQEQPAEITESIPAYEEAEAAEDASQAEYAGNAEAYEMEAF